MQKLKSLTTFRTKNLRSKGWGNDNVILQSGESRDEGSSTSFEDVQVASEQTKNSCLIIGEGTRKREGGLISVSQDLVCHGRKKCIISKIDKSRGSNLSILFRDKESTAKNNLTATSL